MELNSILHAIEEHGLPMVLLVVLILWLKPKFDQLWSKAVKSPEPEERKTFDEVLRIDSEINELLVEIVNHLHVFRATVWQFHNGAWGLGGVPFLRVSATHQKNDSSHPGYAHLYQNIPLSLFLEPAMLLVPVYKIEANSPHSPLRGLLSAYGIGQLYLANICNSQGTNVGCLTVCYPKDTTLPRDTVDEIHEYAERLAILLDLQARLDPKKKEA